MTSQKRYRHHESNSASRFRDIAPRFKRQKSSSSPKPTEDIQNQENQCITRSVLPDSEFPCMSESMTPLPSNKADMAPFNPDENTWQYNSSRGSPHAVLTQVENNFVEYSDPNWNSVSPVSYHNPSVFPGTPLYTWQPQQLPQVHPALYQQRLYQPLMTRNCVSPSLKMAEVKHEDPVFNMYPDTIRTASPLSSASSVSPGPATMRPENQHTSTPDYSDPDIRTIEMLRELERVADEKEKEDEKDPTIDRKNLVSHHLRMLMCAVDRYTEGVDDEFSSNSNKASKISEKNKSESSFPNQSARQSNIHKPLSPQYEQPLPHLNEGAWQKVTPNNSRKLSRQQHSPAPPSRSYTPHMTTPPPVTSPVKTPPPSSRSAAISPLTPPMPTQMGNISSPYMQQRPSRGMMRAITRYNDDQAHAPVMTPPPQHSLQPLSSSSLSHTPPFSPAQSPPLKQKSVWCPMSMDSPADVKSWDLWSGPSFHTGVYGPQPNTHPGMVPPTMNNFHFAQSLYPVEHCSPVDLREHMPLYKR